ncbi:hypothetical protein J5Y03_01415 [Bacillus sp. RG28]|uniref:Lipoprotein n=1 Tax=Gottfriedia endophytica TaxID=2820819 RepID=A0A940NKH3_9BACI|nr:hypothetical protein [Gottfriedia endophytica]MBP0723839.1 hypothetical protein [Gottfriedia endophytica]
MNKWLTLTVLFLFINLTSCSSNDGMKGDKPPKTMIQIGGQTYETKLGTYCWSSKGKGECVDTAGPVELLKGKKPIEVKPGEDITVMMNYNPKPNEIHLTQINNNKEIKVAIEKNHFKAPSNKGLYYYAYSVRWMDKKKEHTSNGDAFYAFALEVK